MGFKDWMEMSSLRDLLKNVPQNPKWHPEGSCWNHVRMVRQALPVAVAMFEKVRADRGSAFSSFTPISKQDEDILRLSAWMHDIGKASATAFTNPDRSRTPLSDFEGFDVKDLMAPDFGDGKWQSIGHERPNHYEPMLGRLGGPWQQMLQKLKPEDKEVLWFIVQKHMDLDAHGIHRSLRNQMIGSDGKFLPDRKFKLWIVFKLMDVMGRGAGLDRAEGDNALKNILAAAEEKRASQTPPKASPQTPQDMEKMLRAKGLGADQIRDIIAKKFGGR